MRKKVKDQVDQGVLKCDIDSVLETKDALMAYKRLHSQRAGGKDIMTVQAEW